MSKPQVIDRVLLKEMAIEAVEELDQIAPVGATLADADSISEFDRRLHLIECNHSPWTHELRRAADIVRRTKGLLVNLAKERKATGQVQGVSNLTPSLVRP